MWPLLVVAAVITFYGITDMIGRAADRRAGTADLRAWRRSVHAHDRFVRDLRPTPTRRPYGLGGAR